MSLLTLTAAYAEAFTSSTSWVVNHNLDTDAPVVDCYEDGTDERIMPASVVATDENTVTITWSVATAGRVYVV